MLPPAWVAADAAAASDPDAPAGGSCLAGCGAGSSGFGRGDGGFGLSGAGAFDFGGACGLGVAFAGGGVGGRGCAGGVAGWGVTGWPGGARLPAETSDTVVTGNRSGTGGRRLARTNSPTITET
jgi:hypothetical protein